MVFKSIAEEQASFFKAYPNGDWFRHVERMKDLHWKDQQRLAWSYEQDDLPKPDPTIERLKARISQLEKQVKVLEGSQPIPFHKDKPAF